MNIKEYIKEVQDFPKEGISFKDIQPILKNPEALNYVIDEFSKHIGDADVIVAPDARGFLFGVPVAAKTNKPFVMVRKPGKLPGKNVSMEYDLEYGTNTLEMAIDAINPGDKVVVIDDLLATGGTTKAIIDLVEQAGGVIEKLLFVIELSFLDWKALLGDKEVISLLKY